MADRVDGGEGRRAGRPSMARASTGRPAKEARESDRSALPERGGTLGIRRDIVAAATRLFSERSYSGTTMRDIAEEIGIQKASLYHHVRVKEDLLFAIHEELLEELLAATLPVISSATPPDEKIREIIHVGMDFIARHRDGVAVFLQERHFIHGERWNVIAGKRDMYERLVLGIVTEGMRSGAFVPTEPKIATRGLLAMMWWCYTWYRNDGPLTADEIAEVFADMVLLGLGRRPEKTLVKSSA